MPELEEVFRVATQKVRRDPGAMDRQIEKQRRAARNRKVVALAVVAVIVIAVVSAAAVLNRDATTEVPSSQPPPTSLPHVQFPTGNITSSLVDLDSGVVTPLPQTIASAAGDAYAVSPDQTQVAFSAYSSPHALYVANIDGTNMHQVSPSGVDTYGVQWSPDGTKLVYQQRDATTTQFGNLFVLDLATGSQTQVTAFHPWDRSGWWFLDPSFAPDGSVVYQMPTRADGNLWWELWTFPVAGGPPYILKEYAGWGALGGTGDRSLAYVTSISPKTFHGGQLMVGNPRASGGPRAIRLAQGSIVDPEWSPDGTRIAYQNGKWIDVVDVATGEVTQVVQGGNPEWFDDHTLTIGG